MEESSPSVRYNDSVLVQPKSTTIRSFLTLAAIIHASYKPLQLEIVLRLPLRRLQDVFRSFDTDHHRRQHRERTRNFRETARVLETFSSGLMTLEYD
jgi:hypothetical protein